MNENATQVDAYFDDVKMTYTPGNVIQSSEYYPFGMQTASSWTRDNVTGNNFLGNGGTELNTTSQVYDLDYRNYDPILGRMNQTDPLADQFSSLSPYHYSYNNPVGFNDPSGALPWSSDFAESYIGSDYGSRNAWAKMVAHGGMAQFVGGAGEGWDGYVGGFGLAENGFGVGASEPGPTVYSPWCGCRVSAFEVMSQDPVNQNASFRAKAQSAVDSYIDGGSRQKNIVDRVLDWLPGKRKNGTDVLVSGPTNIQIGIKRGASVTFNPISTVFRQKEWTNKSDNNSYIISDDANKRYHTEFGLDWGLGINYKNLIDTGDPYGTLDGTYKSDVSELTVSYFGLAVKFSWGTDGGAIFYGGNLGVGLGVGIGGSAETYHGNSIQLWDK